MGRLVPVGNHEALANAILEALNDEEAKVRKEQKSFLWINC